MEKKITKTNFRVEDFKDIKNYIHNTLGITKEEIRELFWKDIEEIVHNEVLKCLNDGPRLTNLIQEDIVGEIKRLDNQERRSWPMTIMDDIYNKIDKTIHEEVRKRLVVELKEPNSDEDNYYQYRYGVIDVNELPDKQTAINMTKYTDQFFIYQLPNNKKYIFKDEMFMEVCDYDIR